MKLCVVQTRPIRGNIAKNIAQHKKMIEHAVFNRANIIIFPELSITGYEPTLAKDLATDLGDPRLDGFQGISDSKNIIIGVGLPLKNKGCISISMILFQPFQTRQVYSKKYLHVDEEPFFVSGESTIGLLPGNISLAICYEISVAAHSEHAYSSGAELYMASVAKTASGVEKANNELSAIAIRYSMPVLMSNCVGHCDDFDCGGKTSAWNKKGVLAGQLNDKDEGLLIFDTDTEDTVKVMI
jgi:predicted amidohydrolase